MVAIICAIMMYFTIIGRRTDIGAATHSVFEEWQQIHLVLRVNIPKSTPLNHHDSTIPVVEPGDHQSQANPVLSITSGKVHGV